MNRQQAGWTMVRCDEQQMARFRANIAPIDCQLQLLRLSYLRWPRVSRVLFRIMNVTKDFTKILPQK
ncbi:unnamed protein product [Ceratitis capitata]|uniref:(Mediterranean fruit fly) hypothetical protein n=1 Tax=Ceratitis capitata TaxID=7213 RepID=A0A811UNE5_CERCA|nr:unnamed protein product [Ceratitis capitata]